MRIFGESYISKLMAAVLCLFLLSCSSDQQDQDEDLDTEDSQAQQKGDETAEQEDIDPADELAEETDEGALDAMSSLSELTEAIQETEPSPEPIETFSAPEAPAPTATPGVVYVGYNVGNVLFVKNASGSIYSSPDASAAPAGALSGTDRVTVQGRKGTWIQIGENQWVPFADLSADIRMAKNGTHFVTAYRLNIRNEPNGKVLGQLAKGETVTVQGTSGNWIKIGSQQYVHKKYVSNKIAH